MASIDMMRIYGDVDGEGGFTSLSLCWSRCPTCVGMRARGGYGEMGETPSLQGGRELYPFLSGGRKLYSQEVKERV